MNTITIDCGASFLKGAVFTEAGEIQKQLQWQAPPVHGNEDIRRPVQIQALQEQVCSMLEALAAGMDEACLCLANEMHGFLLAKEDGTPDTDYISWQKEFGRIAIAGNSAMTALSAPEMKPELQRSGMPLRAGLPNVNLWYLIRNGLAEEKLYFYTLGDYLLRRLSGQQPYCHPTNAAATGLFDLYTGCWNERLLDLIGASPICFPEIISRPLYFMVNHCRIHALPALGDQQAALYGAGLSNEDELSFNLGTGAQVSVLAPHLECAELYQIRPYLGGRYIKTIPHLPAGRALNVYIRFMKNVLDTFGQRFQDEEIWERVLYAASQAPDAGLQCDLSFFSNPLTPGIRGSIMNIGENTLTVGTLWRSIFQQMAKNFVWAADQIVCDSAKLKKIIFSGGVARKITPIQQYIRQHYGEDVGYQVARNETLYGLYKYGSEYQKNDVEG